MLLTKTLCCCLNLYAGAEEVRVVLARARACLSLTRDEEDEAAPKRPGGGGGGGGAGGSERVVLLDWNAEGKCYNPPKPAV
jgi:hypothetical protein